jgi:hypothetical protein
VRVSFLDRLLRQLRAARPQDRTAVLDALLDLEAALANPARHSGMGLRKLHPTDLWEVRIGLALRVLFRLSRDEAFFVFRGTHDDVKHFLKNLS